MLRNGTRSVSGFSNSRFYSKQAVSRASELPFHNKTDPQYYGALAGDDNVKVISIEEAQKNSLRKEQNGEDIHISRLHPDTQIGRLGGRTSLIIPKELSSEISKATLRFDPQKVRQRASQYYLSLAEGGANQPTKSALDVETSLSAAFLPTYASIYSVLGEARRRLGNNWKPKRILDVGFGPATGIIALNEIFAEDKDWNPERKLSVIIGSPLMKRRAVDLLSQQMHEIRNNEDENNDEGLGKFGAVDQEIDMEAKTSRDLETEAIEVDIDSSESPTPEKTPKIQTVIHQTVPPPQSTAKYDLIIATHQLYRSGDHFPASVDQHTSHLLSLLSPGGVVLFIERGDPKGFESIARSRQVMIRPENHTSVEKEPRPYKDSKSTLKILAPCSHHGKCPLQVDMGGRKRSAGFFHWCRFAQSVQRPKFTLELKKGTYLAQEWNEETPGRGKGGKSLSGKGRPYGKSHETISYSYIIVQKSDVKGNHQETTGDNWPRILSPPTKRDKHVIMNMCAPSGTVEQWTVTKSQGKQEYHDARKADGGDLWALDAKVKVARGGNNSKLKKVLKKSSRSGSANQGLKNKLEDLECTEYSKDNETIDIDRVVDKAWASNKDTDPILTRGNDPSPYYEDGGSIEEHFDFIGKQFEQSSKSKKIDQQLNRSKYANKW